MNNSLLGVIVDGSLQEQIAPTLSSTSSLDQMVVSPVSCTNKTDHHDITDILLKVVAP